MRTHVTSTWRSIPWSQSLAIAAVLFGAAAIAILWRFGWLSNVLGDSKSFVGPSAMVWVAIFVAASLSSTVGFAFSAIAAAMIFHIVPDPVAGVQMMMTASIGLQAYSVIGLRQTICWRACMPFLLGGMATIPLGIYLLLRVPSPAYVLVLAFVLVLYGAYMLLRMPLPVKKGGSLVDGLVGALGGLTGPLAAFPGMFVTIWCGMRGWDKATQRSIYQPYILVIQILSLIGLSLASGKSVLNLDFLAYAFPGAAGAYIGLRVFHKLSDMQFQRLVSLALIASGVFLAFK
jgi:uncharacterized membrane protein YfcA